MKVLLIVVTFILSQPILAMDCASSARAEPKMKENSITGFRVYNVVKNGQWAARGFQNEDILIEANGVRVNSFQQLAEAMPLICTAKHGNFRVLRNGPPIDLKF